MAQRYRQKELDPPTGFPPWEMEAMEYTGSNFAELQAWCPYVTQEGAKVKLHGSEIVSGQWIIKNIQNSLFSPATLDFLQYHDPV